MYLQSSKNRSSAFKDNSGAQTGLIYVQISVLASVKKLIRAKPHAIETGLKEIYLFLPASRWQERNILLLIFVAFPSEHSGYILLSKL